MSIKASICSYKSNSNMVTHRISVRATFSMSRSALPAFVALTMAAQIVPSVNAAGVAVVPVEADRVAADGGHNVRAGRGFVHRQQIHRLRFGLTRWAARVVAFLVAGGAGAGFPKPPETPGAAVAVLPVDLHAGALGLEHPDPCGVGGIAGQCLLLALDLAAHFGGADEPDAFVAHVCILS